MALIRYPPRPRWRGFSFALHPDTVQGFYFAQMQYSPKQAFTACFAVSMQLYRPRHKTAHGALQRLFLQLHLFNRPQYQTDTTSHCTACATLEGIHTPRRFAPIPDTTATHGRYTGQHSQPIIIMYIRGHTMPARRRGSGQGGRSGTLHPAGQSNGGRCGTIGGFRRSSFRAFAR